MKGVQYQVHYQVRELVLISIPSQVSYEIYELVVVEVRTKIWVQVFDQAWCYIWDQIEDSV